MVQCCVQWLYVHKLVDGREKGNMEWKNISIFQIVGIGLPEDGIFYIEQEYSWENILRIFWFPRRIVIFLNEALLWNGRMDLFFFCCVRLSPFFIYV